MAMATEIKLRKLLRLTTRLAQVPRPCRRKCLDTQPAFIRRLAAGLGVGIGEDRRCVGPQDAALHELAQFATLLPDRAAPRPRAPVRLMVPLQEVCEKNDQPAEYLSLVT